MAPNITAGYPYYMSVFWRRTRDIVGPDAREFSAKHPNLDGAVDGFKSRMAQLEKQRTTNK